MKKVSLKTVGKGLKIIMAPTVIGVVSTGATGVGIAGLILAFRSKSKRVSLLMTGLTTTLSGIYTGVTGLQNLYESDKMDNLINDFLTSYDNDPDIEIKKKNN